MELTIHLESSLEIPPVLEATMSNKGREFHFLRQPK